jgi:hypothetical protein
MHFSRPAVAGAPSAAAPRRPPLKDGGHEGGAQGAVHHEGGAQRAVHHGGRGGGGRARGRERCLSGARRSVSHHPAPSSSAQAAAQEAGDEGGQAGLGVGVGGDGGVRWGGGGKGGGGVWSSGAVASGLLLAEEGVARAARRPGAAPVHRLCGQMLDTWVGGWVGGCGCDAAWARNGERANTQHNLARAPRGFFFFFSKGGQRRSLPPQILSFFSPGKPSLTARHRLSLSLSLSFSLSLSTSFSLHPFGHPARQAAPAPTRMTEASPLPHPKNHS